LFHPPRRRWGEMMSFEMVVLEDAESPSVVIKLGEGHTLTAELFRERGVKRLFLRLAVLDPSNEVLDTAEIPADRVDKLKQPRFDSFRAILKKALPANTTITDLQSFLKTRVVPRLLELWRAYVARKREERRKRLEKLIERYSDEIEKIKQDPVGYALKTLNYLHIDDEEAKRALLLVIASRFLPREYRLSAVIQGPSSAGKNHLVNSIRKLTPRKWWFPVTRLTTRAIDYLPKSLGRQVLYIQEYEGLKEAAYSVRITVSEGELIIAYVARDPKTGELKTVQKKILGTPIIITTTTKIELDEDMENRTMFIYIDTSEEQTKKIIEYHKRLASDVEFKQFIEQKVKRRCMAYRIFLKTLQKLDVIIPRELLEEFERDMPLTIRTRRDYPRLISFIKAHAVLNQHRRKIIEVDGKRYVVADMEDVEFVKRHIYPRLRDLMIGLKQVHKEVYQAVKALVEDEGKAWVTVREVQRMLKGYSYRWVKQAMDDLVEKGLLSVDTSTKPYRYTLAERMERQRRLA